MSDLPKGWTETTIGEISESINYGFTAKASQINNGVKYLRITDIQDNKVDWETVPFCEISESNAQKYLLGKGDIVFARTGATTGKSFLIESCPKAVFASYLIRLRTTAEVLPEFVAQFFQSHFYWQQITENISGSAQPNCNASKLSTVKLALPPLNEQKRIVEKLEKLLGKVEAVQARLDKIPAVLKRFRQAVLAAACSGKLTADWRENKEINLETGLPIDWKIEAVGNVIESSFYGTRFGKDEYKDYGIPTIRTTDMDNLGRIVLNNPPLIPISPEKLKQIGLQHEDLLITRTGATIGKCAVYDESLGLALPSAYLIRFRFNRKLVFVKYFFYFLLSPNGQNLLTGGSTAVAQPNINAETIKKFSFPFPPLEEQKEIVRRVEDLFRFADQIEARYRRARGYTDKLTQSILAKAFRGELVAQDERDEPASILLERISQERGDNASANRDRGASKKKFANQLNLID